MGRCGDCRFWARLAEEKQSYGGNKGECQSGKFLYHGDLDQNEKTYLSTGKYLRPTPDDVLIYWDFEDYSAGVCTGENFGCVHFSRREK